MSCWSCRFISEADREALQTLIRTSNYDVHFSWYPFTGEEAPIPLDDIEDDEEEEEEEEQEDQDHEFLNYWNDPPLPGIGSLSVTAKVVLKKLVSSQFSSSGLR